MNEINLNLQKSFIVGCDSERKIRALARCHVTLRDIKLKMNENRETKTILLQAYIFFNLLVKTYLVIGLCCW